MNLKSEQQIFNDNYIVEKVDNDLKQELLKKIIDLKPQLKEESNNKSNE